MCSSKTDMHLGTGIIARPIPEESVFKRKTYADTPGL